MQLHAPSIGAAPAREAPAAWGAVWALALAAFALVGAAVLAALAGRAARH